MDKERAELHERQSALREDELALEQEEVMMWRELNELHFYEETFADLRDVARAQITSIEVKNMSIQQLNILNDMFYIGHSGPFATINNFRVGQLASVPVEWNEINAGLGEAALLLQTLAGVVGIDFSEYVGIWFFRILEIGLWLIVFNFVILFLFYVIALRLFLLGASRRSCASPTCAWNIHCTCSNFCRYDHIIMANIILVSQAWLGSGQFCRVAFQSRSWGVDHVSAAAHRVRRGLGPDHPPPVQDLQARDQRPLGALPAQQADRVDEGAQVRAHGP